MIVQFCQLQKSHHTTGNKPDWIPSCLQLEHIARDDHDHTVMCIAPLFIGIFSIWIQGKIIKNKIKLCTASEATVSVQCDTATSMIDSDVFICF